MTFFLIIDLISCGAKRTSRQATGCSFVLLYLYYFTIDILYVDNKAPEEEKTVEYLPLLSFLAFSRLKCAGRKKNIHPLFF